MTAEQSVYTLADYDNAANYIQQQTALRPTIGMILGSGLGPLANEIEDATIIPSEDIPNWPKSTVVGHSGRLVIGTLEGRTVLVMQGRVHFYEGYEMARVTFPVRVMQRFGIKTLVVTNAAGGADPSYVPGDLMLIQDHINFPGMAGSNPLFGPNNEELGTRFPSMTHAYDRALRQLAHRVADAAHIGLHEGVYGYVAGPMFETPAEIRMLRVLGVNAVGMSTAPEVVAAAHGGMRVLGISGITNSSIDDPDVEEMPNHEEVIEEGKSLVPKLITLLRGILQEMDEVS